MKFTYGILFLISLSLSACGGGSGGNSGDDETSNPSPTEDLTEPDTVTPDPTTPDPVEPEAPIAYTVRSQVSALNTSPTWVELHHNGNELGQIYDNDGSVRPSGLLNGQFSGSIDGLPEYDWREGDYVLGYAVVGANGSYFLDVDDPFVIGEAFFFNGMEGNPIASMNYSDVDYSYIIVGTEDISTVTGFDGTINVDFDAGTINGNLGAVVIDGNTASDGQFSGTATLDGVEADMLGASYTIDGDATTAGAFAGNNGDDSALAGGWYEQN